MTEQNKAVFLSYASQDAEAARHIAEALRSAGLEVWFDQSELRGGDAWDQKIRRHIRECALFVPIISAHTASRHEGYFRLEWDLADHRTHMIARDHAFIIPVCIDSTPHSGTDVPESFARVQWIRIAPGQIPSAFVELLRSLLSSQQAQPLVEIATLAGSSNRSKLALWLIAALLLVGVGYVTLDRLVLSKRTNAAVRNPTASALTRAPMPSAISEKSIAVLPFMDLSEKGDQAYFSDGLADELLDLLAKTPGIIVIARTSSFSFKSKADDIPTIGRKLNVANILEGSVRKFGNRLRVTTQLIRASTGEHLWSETYDRKLQDVFVLQDEIAAAVVSQLKLKLAPVQPSPVRRTASVEAYDEYLLGQQFFKTGNAEDWPRAIDAYRRAIVLDRNYVSPYDGLALAEFALADESADAAGYQRAKDAAEKAVELGPNDPDGYGARGFIRTNLTWDWAGARSDLEKAIALDPGDERYQLRYGELLATLGRLPEAIAALRRATELDPLSAPAWNDLAVYLQFTRDFTAAHEASHRALEISPDSTLSRYNLGTLQLIEGNAAEALATFRKVADEALRQYGVALAQHSLKDENASQQTLDELIAKYARIAPYQIAVVYAWRGEKDQTFEWLERAYAKRDSGLAIIKCDPLIDSLLGDPRYLALLRKMKLAD